MDGEVGLCRAVVGDVGELVRGWSATGGGGRSPKIRIEQSTDRKRGGAALALSLLCAHCPTKQPKTNPLDPCWDAQQVATAEK